jgi:hypothetical protein
LELARPQCPTVSKFFKTTMSAIGFIVELARSRRLGVGGSTPFTLRGVKGCGGPATV